MTDMAWHRDLETPQVQRAKAAESALTALARYYLSSPGGVPAPAPWGAG